MVIWTILGGLAFLSCQAWEWTSSLSRRCMVGKKPVSSWKWHCGFNQFYQFLFYHHWFPWLPRFLRSYNKCGHADYDAIKVYLKEKDIT